jgi:phosphoglycerate dehydrogenase-like enzyme
VFHEEPLPPANPLWSHPRVRLTSHTSFAGSGVRSRWDALFLDNITRFVRGDALVSEVAPRDLA